MLRNKNFSQTQVFLHKDFKFDNQAQLIKYHLMAND